MVRSLMYVLLLATVPMTLLNPMGRPAFLGYYLGIATMWLAAVVAHRVRAADAVSPIGDEKPSLSK